MIEKIQRFPFSILLIMYIAYLGLQYYNYNLSSDGEVEQHHSRVTNAQAEVEGLKKKLVEGKKFLKSLDLKKIELQEQVKKLSDFQGALSEAPDVPSLIRLLLTEAKKNNMKVDKIEPGRKDQKEYYLDQEFKLSVRGSYQQILVFAHRISQMQRILRIEGFDFKQSGESNANSRAVSLVANLSVRAYQYTLSKEDQIGKGHDKK